jgi:hypothetical protein
MKQALKWILASLLAFQPALATQGAADLQGEFKRFIELSGMTQKSVSLQELYDKFSSFLPPSEQARLKPFIEAFGSTKLPKMDLATFKTPSGVQAYKLSYAQKGQSGTFEFFGDPQTVYKINGQAFGPQDASSVDGVLKLARLPANISGNLFPYEAIQNGFLSAQEFTQLSLEDQKKYLRQFQELIASIETIQNFEALDKSNANSFTEKYQYFVLLFSGQWAHALEAGKACLIGGNESVVAIEKGGRFKCGVVNNGTGPRPDLKGNCRKPNEVQCNKALFGPEAGCAEAGPKTTELCITSTTGGRNDIPDFANKKNEGQKAEFDRLRSIAIEESKRLEPICKEIQGKAVAGKLAGLIKDQQETCKRFFERFETIQSWNCEEDQFKKDYPKICANRPPPPAAGGATPPPGSPAPGTEAQVPGAVGAPAQVVQCKDLKEYQVSDSPIQCGKLYAYKAPTGTKCLQDGKTLDHHKLWSCKCQNGEAPGAKGSCSQGTVSAGTDQGPSFWDKTKSWFSKNSKWLVPLGFGMAGLLLFHWMMKQQAKQYYNWVNPIPQNPPVSPNPTVPVPRGTQ